MHVRARLEDLPPLVPGPHHEGVHGALHVRLPVATLLPALPDDLGAEHLGCREDTQRCEVMETDVNPLDILNTYGFM